MNSLESGEKSGYEEKQFHLLGSHRLSRRITVSLAIFLVGFLLIVLLVATGGTKSELILLSGFLAAIAGFLAEKFTDCLFFMAAFALGIVASFPFLVLAVILLEPPSAMEIFERDLRFIGIAAVSWLLGALIGGVSRKLIRHYK